MIYFVILLQYYIINNVKGPIIYNRNVVSGTSKDIEFVVAYNNIIMCTGLTTVIN